MPPAQPPAIPDRLLMVYNADEGLFNALNDWAHKFFSPATYECRLCRYTYGVTGMLAPWKIFLERQPFPTAFFHRPDFRKAYPEYNEVELPLIHVDKAGHLDVLVLAEEIGETGGLISLINLVQSRLEQWQPWSGPDGTPATPKS